MSRTMDRPAASARSQFWLGVTMFIPVAISIASYGVVWGVLAGQKGLSVLEVLLMSGLVFAGSSQFVALDSWTPGALPIVSIVVATAIVNLRMLLMSATYRQSSRHRDDAAKVDPANRLLWRMNLRRLEAEVLRDSILAASGKVNLQGGGPGIKPRVRAELLTASQRNKWPVVTEENKKHWRRSVYIYSKRQLLMPMMELFDAPTTTDSCSVRLASVVPTQALLLMNDEFVEDQAGYLAERAVAGHVAIPDAGDEHGLDEPRALLGLRAGRERARLARERLEQLLYALELGLVEAGACLARVVELTVRVEPERDRTEPPGAAAVAVRPAADDDLRGLEVLDLQPAG